MIDAIYCLSRPERQDRRDALIPMLERAFSEGQFPRLDVIWWSEPLREHVLIPGSFRGNPGYYAATVGHRMMLEDAWKKGFNEVLILEDDARFDNEFYRSFPTFMETIRQKHPDWLALWLGYTTQKSPVDLGNNVLLNKGSTQSHAYIVNRHGIWRLFDHLWVRNQMIVDWAYCELMGMDSCVYSPKIPQIGVINSYSDNLNSFQCAL